MNRQILHGDALDRLKNIDSDSIDLMCTDPPYGYAFMNNDWDKAVIGVDIWKECLRVLKPGAFAFVMSAPRQDVMSRMIVNLQDAGFVTSFTPIFWAYATGFIKASNIGKQIDKKLGKEREIIGKGKCGKTAMLGGLYEKETNQGSYNFTKPSSPQAKKLNGSYAGFQPKPAVEVILVCMKPLSEKNYTEQAMRNGKGITWLDDCAIPYVDKNDIGDPDRGKGYPLHDENKGWNKNKLINNITIGEKGRYPANLLVSNDVLNDGKITKGVSSGGPKEYGGGGGWENRINRQVVKTFYNDEGSFSRYFDLDAWFAQHLSQFIIAPKASKSERNKNFDIPAEKNVRDGRKDEENQNLDSFIIKNTENKQKIETDNSFKQQEEEEEEEEINLKNTHPTVKPVKLFSYLITLGSREHDMILDPFVGSGTTAVACHMLARGYIGIEKEQEYIDIANVRVSEFVKTQVLGEFC